ncbi:DNA cytosine methyltransferase [Vibrio splendidus]|uniref:DNA cytosine methyltransferase n=1 Tax=Vibrio splendidus TaxID=29497 RepID=UPI000C8261CE|nr:DNA cytosine methyltransferase [Vibrio splendidus]PMH09506.1 DNA (cytosine-5-)-methyltransferase [Vibrio splendidus]
MKTISLFSGCGGMDLGAEQAGANIIFSSDIDHDACESLRKYFPETNVHEGDIADVTEFPEADMLIGGYPCQSFSLGGNRDPEKDPRTKLYLQYVRCLEAVKPKFFVAENVSGLTGLKGGAFFKEQFEEFENQGYRVTAKLLNARDYGVPQMRKRLLIVGVRNDLNRVFIFPKETHGKATKKNPDLLPYTSHGEVIKDLPLWPEGEFYERPHDPEGHMSWYYMSRNRKKNWDEPAFTVVANWRHITIHPASPKMTLTWSNLEDGYKQRWDFSDEYEHLEANPERPILQTPRRLSWRECARIQTFPHDFEPEGKVESKFQQIGNAVPPKLANVIFSHLISEKGLITHEELLNNEDIQKTLTHFSK